MTEAAQPGTTWQAVGESPLRPSPSQSKREAQTTSLGEYRISHSSDVKIDFLEYLSRTSHYQFRLIGSFNNCEVVKILPFVHRWMKIYQNSVLAKFYTLDRWMEENPEISRVVTMFTLTVYQNSKSRYNDGSYSRKAKGRDLTYQESLALLLISRSKLLNVLRNRYPGVNYVWVMEAHKTGFPHCHLLIFKEFTETEQNAIKELWSSKYEAGSHERGVKISTSKNSENIRSMKNYLMKYMDKQFGIGSEGWTDGDLLFNAMMWKTKTRMWGASKELTAVMRRPDKVSDVVWDTVELLTPGGKYEVWSRDKGEPFPALDAEQDPNEEGQVTKWMWERMYWAERIWREQCRIQTEWSKKAWGVKPL